MRRLTKLALGITAVWVLAFVLILLCNRDALSTMTLNEWGDFLAGASAPLALFWLVIGYFQHGQELHLNTRALKAQEDELRRQVEATTTLADNAERQARAAEGLVQISHAERERAQGLEIVAAQPVLVGAGGSSSGAQFIQDFQNRGGEVTDPELDYQGPHSLTLSPSGRLESDAKGRLTLLQTKGVPLQYPIRFGLTYTDRFRNRRVQRYEIRQGWDLRDVTHAAMDSDGPA